MDRNFLKRRNCEPQIRYFFFNGGQSPIHAGRKQTGHDETHEATDLTIMNTDSMESALSIAKGRPFLEIGGSLSIESNVNVKSKIIIATGEKMSKETIVHIGTLHAKPDYADSLIKSFDGLKQASGYISHTCYRDIEDKNKLTLVEKWESKKDHENFVNAFSKEDMDGWLNMLSQKPEDSYYREA